MKRSDNPVVLVPPGVVTVVSTVPAGAEGDVATQVVAVEHDTAVAVAVPTLTEVEVDPVTKPVPLMVKAVPPPRGP